MAPYSNRLAVSEFEETFSTSISNPFQSPLNFDHLLISALFKYLFDGFMYFKIVIVIVMLLRFQNLKHLYTYWPNDLYIHTLNIYVWYLTKQLQIQIKIRLPLNLSTLARQVVVSTESGSIEVFIIFLDTFENSQSPPSPLYPSPNCGCRMLLDLLFLSIEFRQPRMTSPS